METKVKISCEEHRNDLLYNQQIGRLVDQMAQMPGWAEVIRPTLETKLVGLSKDIVTMPLTDLTKVITIQERIKAIQELLNMVDGYVNGGKQATEILKKDLKRGD